MKCYYNHNFKLYNIIIIKSSFIQRNVVYIYIKYFINIKFVIFNNLIFDNKINAINVNYRIFLFK